MKQFINKTNVNEDDIIKNKNLLVKVISADAGMEMSYLMFQLKTKLFKIKKLPIYSDLGISYKEMNKLTLNRNTYIKYLATHLANKKGDDKLKKIYKLIVFAILQMSPLYYKYYICTNCLFRNIVELLHMSLQVIVVRSDVVLFNYKICILIML